MPLGGDERAGDEFFCACCGAPGHHRQEGQQRGAGSRRGLLKGVGSIFQMIARQRVDDRATCTASAEMAELLGIPYRPRHAGRAVPGRLHDRAPTSAPASRAASDDAIRWNRWSSARSLTACRPTPRPSSATSRRSSRCSRPAASFDRGDAVRRRRGVVERAAAHARQRRRDRAQGHRGDHATSCAARGSRTATRASTRTTWRPTASPTSSCSPTATTSCASTPSTRRRSAAATTATSTASCSASTPTARSPTSPR